MSLTHKQFATVIAVVVLLTAVPMLWQLESVRATQAAQSQQDDLVDQAVTARQTPDDYDGDGVPDDTDRCPTRPETENSFQDQDGCPDVVETTGAS